MVTPVKKWNSKKYEINNSLFDSEVVDFGMLSIDSNFRVE